MDNPRYKSQTIDRLLNVETDCVECSGKDYNCKHIYMCDADRICIFRSMYEDLFKGDNNGN